MESKREASLARLVIGVLAGLAALWVVLLAALFLSGCVPTWDDKSTIVTARYGELRPHPEAYTVRVIGAPDAAMARAVVWWNQQLMNAGCRPYFILSPTLEADVRVVEDDIHPEQIANATLEFEADGTITGAVIRVTRGYGSESNWLHIAHELGHVLSLDDDPHSFTFESVMAAPPSARVTPADLNLVCSRQEVEQ